MAPLPMIGELSYNGVQFDSASTVEVSCEFTKDAAGRTTTTRQITLDIDGWLAPIQDERDVDALVVALSKQGGPLIYEGNGFPIRVNVEGDPNTSTDVNFGPSPKIFDFTPKGGGTAAKIKWQVTTWIPACTTTSNTFGSLQEFNYQVSWSTKPSGYTIRAITGHFKVPLGRFTPSALTTSRTVEGNADNYREAIFDKFPQPVGWKRSSNFTLSADKSAETFSITDEEIESENPWPRFATNVQARHRIAWNLRGGGRIQNRISATITMRQGFDAGAAHFVFRQLCDRRLGSALRLAKMNGGIVLIESMEADEDLYGKSHQFSVGYRVTMKLPSLQQGRGNSKSSSNSSLIVLGEKFLILSAFNSPIATNTWEQWNESMADSAYTPGPHGPRGTGGPAGTTWGTDRIVDLCDGAGAQVPFTRPEGFKPTIAIPGPSVWAVEKPREETSWLTYRHEWLKIGSAYSTDHVKYLAKINIEKPPVEVPSGGSGPITKEDFASEVTFDDSKLQRLIRQGNGETWLLRGSVERAVFKLPDLPQSIRLRDQKATMFIIDGYVARQERTTPLGLKVNSGSFAALYVPNKSLGFPPPDFCFP